MRQHIKEYVEDFINQLKPLDCHLSDESLDRFICDDRLWPIDLWVKAPQHNGPGLLTRFQIYPDPCDPEYIDDQLVREWRIRIMDCSNGISQSGECPERIIATCDLSDPMLDLMGRFWEWDNRKTLPNLKNNKSNE